MATFYLLKSTQIDSNNFRVVKPEMVAAGAWVAPEKYLSRLPAKIWQQPKLLRNV